jgi:capsular polysaccharide biosynthesis protein
MIERILEAFFRHWLLIVLPIIVIPLDVAALVFATPPQYESQAGVWVERPTYLSSSQDELTRYLPPASVQRNRLLELTRTRSFLTAVASGTPLETLLNGPNGGAEIDQIFARDFEVLQDGDHLLVVRFRSEESATALSLVKAIVEEFRNRVAQDRLTQAQLAITFYQSLLTESEAALSQARNDLTKYLAANPKVAVTVAQNGIEVARLDTQFAELQRRVDTVQRDADNARGSLQAARLDVAAGNQSAALGFRVVDAAGVSPTASRQLRKLLVYPIAGIVIALVISGSLLLLLTLSDHSVRSLRDLAPDTVILGVLPNLKPAHVARHAGGHQTRRAVGFAAGASLPIEGRKGKAS